MVYTTSDLRWRGVRSPRTNTEFAREQYKTLVTKDIGASRFADAVLHGHADQVNWSMHAASADEVFLTWARLAFKPGSGSPGLCLRVSTCGAKLHTQWFVQRYALMHRLCVRAMLYGLCSRLAL